MNQIGWAAALSLAAATALQGQDFELRRELPPGSRFAIRNIIGDVRVDGTSRRTLEVTGRKKAGRHGDPDDVEIETLEIEGGIAVCVYYPGQWRRDRDDDDRPSRRNRRGDRVEIHDDICRRGSNWGGNDRNDTSVDFVIRVPEGLKLDLATVSGDVIGQRLQGEAIDVATVSGAVSLTDVTTPALEASSVSGDVDLDQVEAQSVSSETVSGDVRYDGVIDPKGSYDFRTLSGDVLLTVPREPDARVSAITFSGDLSSDFPVSRDSTRKRRNRFNALWGSGGAQIDLESFSGDIEIRARR
jgi:hypothetical protein